MGSPWAASGRGTTVGGRPLNKSLGVSPMRNTVAISGLLAAACAGPSVGELGSAKNKELSEIFPIGLTIEAAEAKLLGEHLPKSVVPKCRESGGAGTCIWTSAQVSRPFSGCTRTVELGLVFDSTGRLESQKSHGLEECAIWWPF